MQKELTKYTVNAFPKRVETELASACNLRCTYCPRKHMDNLNEFMDFSLFKKLIDELSEYPNTILVLHRRGESLLHPNFIDACKYVKGKFSQIELATNASLLDEERSKAIIGAIHYISFSIDIPEVFDRTRIPARYSRIESKIKSFLDLNKGKAKTQVSMVKTSETPQKNSEVFKKIWKRFEK